MIRRRVQSVLLCASLVAAAAVSVVTAAPSRADVPGSGYPLGFGSNASGQLGSGSSAQALDAPAAARLPAGVQAVRVAVGYSHTLALGSDGVVYAWGSNSYGELGTGTTTASPLPTPVALPSGTAVAAVAAGYFDSFAVTTTGAVYSWGYGAQGELGTGGTANAATPALVHLPAGVAVSAVSAGYAHVLALTTGGAVYSWGANTAGQLGDGTTTYRPSPVLVHLPSGTVVTMVSAGYAHSLALTSTGGVLGWGLNSRGELGTGTLTSSAVPTAVSLGTGHATSIAAGYQHSVATLSDGSAQAWGDNSQGQLGTGQPAGTLPYSSTPVAVALSGTTVSQAAAGYADTLLLTGAGGVLAAGDNTYGELGDGTFTASATPVPVALPTGSGTLAVAASAFSFTSFVLVPAAATSTTVRTSAASAPAGQPVTFTATVSPSDGTGTVSFTAGDPGSALPGCTGLPLQRVAAFSYRATCSAATLPAGTTAIAAAFSGGAQYQPSTGSLSGGQPVSAVTGAALAWGGNGDGQLGDGSTTNRTAPVAVGLPAGTSVRQLAGGADHGLALLTDGTVYAWGDNTYGELGDGTTTSSDQPVPVTLPAGVVPVSIAAGALTSALVAADGTLYTWGFNNVGQLGDGTTTNRSVPVRAALPAGTVVTAASLGGAHLLALTSTGAVYAAGANTAGQLGDNSDVAASTPVPVQLPAGDAVAGVAAGYSHSLAVTTDGGVLAWGDNSHGALGTGTGAAAVLPQPVTLPAGASVVAVSAGQHDSAALTSTGAALAWGDNAAGQLGTGTAADAPTPAAVALPAGTQLASIAAGSATTYGLTTAGALLGWGDNAAGSVGDGTTTARPTPVSVQLPAAVHSAALGAGPTSSAGYAIAPRLSDQTSLTSTPNPSVAGKAVTFTATVTSTDGGGSVAFSADGTTIPGCAAVPLTSGTASCPTSTLAGGSHVITAQYSGDTFYAASAATLAGGQSVTFVATSTKVSTSAAKTTYGKAVTFTASVSGTDGTGTVGFAADGAPIAGCSAVALSTVLGSRQAKCTTSALAPGSHVITAAYSGTWRLAPSSATLSGGELVQVTTKLVASPVTITTPTGLPSYRAVLTAQPGGAPVAGLTVTFALNALYGSSKCTAVTDASGVATCQGARPRISGGQYTATFAGTASYLASSGSSTVKL